MERRFLTLPAAPPCDGVSPAALLQSIITTGADIRRRHRSLIFPTHRRIVRELAREVAVITCFLSDLPNSFPPPSAVVGFSEIYVAFSKIKLLVSDCGRPGARLWVLLKSDLVAREFHVLARSIATALDVVTLSAIDMAAEAKEALELVCDQAWRADLRADSVDLEISCELRLILAQFEKGIIPDKEAMSKILNYLEINSWNDCDSEIQFLEEELAAAAGNVDEMFILGSLRGFVLYARSVLFDVKSGRKAQRTDPVSDSSLPDNIDLEQFQCPISLEMMTNPVTVSSGQTYEQASIAKWLAAGNLTCPVTGVPLRTAELVPNVALRHLIGLHFRHPPHKKTFLPQITISPAITALCSLLVDRLGTGSDEDCKAKAVTEIRLLSKTSIYERGCLVAAGAVPLLLDLHFSLKSSLQDGAVAAVLNLSKHPDGKAAVFKHRDFAPILHTLSHGLKPEARQNSAAIVFYLASVEDYRPKLGETIPALVELLKTGTDRAKKNATVALIRLLYYRENLSRVVAAGAIAELVGLLSSEREDLVGDCLAALAAIAELPEGAIEILHASAMPALVGVLSRSSRSGKEYCLSVLLHLCSAGGDQVVAVLERVPSLVPALRLVLSEGSSRVSKKASYLIRLLRQDRAALPMLRPERHRDPVPA